MSVDAALRLKAKQHSLRVKPHYAYCIRCGSRVAVSCRKRDLNEFLCKNCYKK